MLGYFNRRSALGMVRVRELVAAVLGTYCRIDMAIAVICQRYRDFVFVIIICHRSITAELLSYFVDLGSCLVILPCNFVLAKIITCILDFTEAVVSVRVIRNGFIHLFAT